MPADLVECLHAIRIVPDVKAGYPIASNCRDRQEAAVRKICAVVFSEPGKSSENELSTLHAIEVSRADTERLLNQALTIQRKCVAWALIVALLANPLVMIVAKDEVHVQP